MHEFKKLWINIKNFFNSQYNQTSIEKYRHISNLDKLSFDIAIKDFFSMTNCQQSKIDLLDIFCEKKKSKKSEINFIITNPFSGITVPVRLISRSKYNRRSYSSFYLSNLYKKDVSKIFEVIINDRDIDNGYVFFKNEYLTFKTILYHELAHSTLESLRNEGSLFHERVADIVSLIKISKDENFNLISFKTFLKNLIMFRAFSYDCSSYFTKRSVLDCHYTLNYLLGLYQLSEDNFLYLMNISDNYLVNYVELLVKSLSPFSDNPLNVMSVDLANCQTILESYNDSIEFDINSYFKHEKRSVKFNKKFNGTVPIELKICLKNRFIKNISTSTDKLTSFLLSNMVKTDFHFVVKTYFNQDDFNYVFEDSKVLYAKYLKRL